MQIFFNICHIISWIIYFAVCFFIGWKAADYIKRIKKLEEKVPYLESIIRNNLFYLNGKIGDLISILKEAGIIISPPNNVKVPNPRGYSVKKVK